MELHLSGPRAGLGIRGAKGTDFAAPWNGGSAASFPSPVELWLGRGSQLFQPRGTVARVATFCTP